MKRYVASCQTKPRSTSGVSSRSTGTIRVAGIRVSRKVTNWTATRILMSRGIEPNRSKPPPPPPNVRTLRGLISGHPSSESGRVAHPLPQLLERWFLAVHEDADPVDAGAGPDRTPEESEGQRIGEEELPHGRHLQGD